MALQTDLLKQKIQEAKERKELESNMFILRWHGLMRIYGWIPYEEFKNLPFVVVQALLGQINDDYEREKKNNEKQKRKRIK